MNLVTGEWIPVLYQNGKATYVSLDTFFKDAGVLSDLALPPPQRIALMRFLICVVQTSLEGPEDEKQWRSCVGKISETARDYLAAHKNEFELYGDNPFMQVPTLEPLYNVVLDKLDFGLSSGNNARLFDHGACKEGRMHNDAWIALMLVTFLNNSPGGKIGVTKWAGKSTQPGKTKGPGESEHAPCVEGSALHSYVRKNNMLDTIHANLITREVVAELPNMEWGRPTWELDCSERDSRDLQKSVFTYLGRLLPLSRAVLFERDSKCFTLANGLTYPKLPECREVTGTVIGRNDNRLGYVATSLDRHPWRELNSLLSFGTQQQGPLAFRHIKNTNSNDVLDVWTGGLAVDKGKILDMGEWSFCIPADMVANDGPLEVYGNGVRCAEKAEKKLYGAIKTYADAMSMEKAPMPKARVHFWSQLDQNYEQLLETANDPSISLDAQWTPLLRKTMRSAYQAACPCTTPRQIQAFAAGQAKLKLPNAEKENA